MHFLMRVPLCTARIALLFDLMAEKIFRSPGINPGAVASKQIEKSSIIFQ